MKPLKNRRFFATSPLIALTAILLMGAGDCGGGKKDSNLPQDLEESDAYGEASDRAIMPEATLIDADTFIKYFEENKIVLHNPTLAEDYDTDEAEQAEEDRKQVEDFVSANSQDPSIKRLTESPARFTEQFQPSQDGNYKLTVSNQRKNWSSTVTTLGQKNLFTRYADILRRKQDPQAAFENDRGAYQDIYDELVANIPSDIINRYEIKSPSSLQSHRELRAEVLRLVKFVPDLTLYLPGGTPPAGRPSTCAGEVEAGPNTDRTANRADCEAFSETGIYQNFQWPQKWYATCVKDQANRGTCGSFGINAAVETAVALRDKRWVNLSEQDLYFRVKNRYYPTIYGDGINTHNVWQRMLDDNYLIPFESQWNYNRSQSRTANDATSTYSGSCTNYQFPNPAPAGPISNFCSNTAGQGGLYCANVGPWQFCGYFSPVASNNTSGYRVKSEWEIWDATDTETSILLTRLALVFKRPAVLWAFVTPSFDNPNASGFVTYSSANETNRGSHIYQITGQIDNDTLREQLPNAPLGAGGGYIIAKNSWGHCFADAGYIYLPFDWVKAYAISVTLMSSVK